MEPNPLVEADRLSERSRANAARALNVFLGDEQPSQSQVSRYAAPSGPEIVQRVLDSNSFRGSALAAVVAGYSSPKSPDGQRIVPEADVAWAYEILSCAPPSASGPVPWNRFVIAFLSAPGVVAALRSGGGANPSVLDQLAPLGGPQPLPHSLAFLHAALLGSVPSAPWSDTEATLLPEAAAILGSQQFRDQILAPIAIDAKLPQHGIWTDNPRWPFRAAAQKLLIPSLDLRSRDVRDTWPRYILRLLTHRDSLLTRLLALEPDLLQQANAPGVEGDRTEELADRLSVTAQAVAAAREALGTHDAVVGTRLFSTARVDLVEAMQRVFLQREPRSGQTKGLTRLPAELALRRLISDHRFLAEVLDPLRAGREPAYEGPREALLDAIHLLGAEIADAVGSSERSGTATSGDELRRFLLAAPLREIVAAQSPLEDAERYVVAALTSLAEVTQQGQDEPRIRLWLSRSPALQLTVQSDLPGDHEVVLKGFGDIPTERRAPLLDTGTGVGVAQLDLESQASEQRLFLEGTVTVRPVDASRNGDQDEGRALTLPFRYDAGGPGFVSEATVLLHGRRRPSSTQPAGSTVADFLDRALAAPAFSSQVAGIRATALTGSDAAFRRLAADILAPLGDPERPYLAAVRERAQSGDSPAALTMLNLMTLQRAVSAAGDDGSSEVFARLVRDAGQRRNADALNAFALAARAGVQFEPEHPAHAPVPDDVRLGETFVRRSLELSGGSGLIEPADRRALATLAQISGREATVILGIPHPIAVDLPETLNDADADRWRRLSERGHLSHLPPSHTDGEGQVWVLTVNPAVGLTPLALSCLACRPLGDGPLGIAAQATPSDRSWAAMAIGYEGDATATVNVGRIASGPAAERAVEDVVVLGTIPRQPTEGTPVADVHLELEHAFALVLRCEDEIDVSDFVNIECCAVFDDVDALIQATTEAGRRVRRKPVIMVGTQTPKVSSYVIDSVQAYWVYGGLCALMGLGLHYDRQTAGFQPFTVSKPRLAPLASPQLTTLPLGDLIDADPVERATMTRAPFVPRQGFTLLHPPPYPVTEAMTASLVRTHSPARFDRSDHERFCLAGEVDRFLLASVDVAQFWPVAHLIAEGVATSRHWESLTERFLAQPSVRNAQQVLDTINVSSGDAWYLADALDRFAVVLTSEPDIALGLTPQALKEFLRLARQTPSFDRVVAQLATFADEVAAKDYSLIIPLFEVLACGLPPSSFNAVLGFTARSLVGARHRSIHRLAECIRRFGDPHVAALALIGMSSNDRALLDSKDFVRCFDRILDSPAAAPVRSRYGRELLERIASSTDPIKAVRQLVVEGDCDGLRTFLRSLDRMQGVDPHRLLDELRGFSNELRDLPLSTDETAFSKGYGLHQRKIAAIVFSDIAALERLAAGGHFDTRGDLSAVARSILGDSDMLNEMLAERFATVGLRSYRVAGQTCVEVYANASASVAEGPANPVPATTGPLVSVAVSAFNPDVSLMRESLRSIAAQSYPSVEVFVVDDASDQKISAQIASLLEEFPHIELIRLDVNCGPYVGRNLVLERAKGEFIAIQDADDWSHPDRFAMQLACLTQAPEIRVVTTPHLRIDRAGAVQLEAGFKVFGDGPMTSMFRREVFDEIGPFAAIRSRGDVEMRERIHAYYGRHAIEELPTPMMLCFAGSETLSQRTKSQHIEYLRAFRTHIKLRRSLASCRREGMKPLGKEHALVVPVPLRPPELDMHGS